MSELHTTECIVLGKLPYREHSLLLQCFSADFGKLDLVANGQQKLDGKHFPAADLFRVLDVAFVGDGELRTARDLELVTAFDGIANDPRSFEFAARIADFIRRNSANDLPAPYTYDALKSVYGMLHLPAGTPGKWDLMRCAVVLKSTYLYENGLLPESSRMDLNELMENIIASGMEGTTLPSCPDPYWKTLNSWLDTLIDHYGLKKQGSAKR